MAITDQPRDDNGATTLRAPSRAHSNDSRAAGPDQQPDTIARLVSAIGPQATLAEIAGPVARTLRSMFRADGCSIATVDGNIVHEIANAGVRGGPQRQRARRPVPLEVLWPLAPHGYHRASGEHGCALADSATGARSLLVAGVGPADEPLGVVAIWAADPDQYSDEDGAYLHELVQPLGMTLAYARGRAEADHRAERLEHMNRALAALGTTDPADVARNFLHECRLLIGAEHGGVLRFNRESESARILAYESDLVQRDQLQDVAPMSWFRLASLLDDPTPALAHDLRTEPGLPHYAQQLVAHGFYSALQIPLILGGRVEGAIALWGRGAHRFSDEDAQLVMTLAGPFAVALERTAALESLAESEARYRSLVAHAEEMIIVFDAETHRLLEVNPHTAEFLGYAATEMADLRLEDLLADAEIPAETLVGDAARGSVELRFRRSDGIAIDVDVVVSPLTVAGREAVLVLGRDASGRKALQRQLIQGQKMESLGTMAGAVAHDFNNLLTTILGFAGLLKRSPVLMNEDRENLALIEEAAHRAADLTGRLLSFARGGLVKFGPLDLRQVIEDTVRLAEPAMHDRISLSVDMAGESVLVEGDGGQVHQALLNIVLNARDAMPADGRIAISLRTEGDHAVVVIADDGPGMDEETRTRIFEPFFTTKPAGSGTGLGMAITYGIVQGHHGSISVESSPGKGTRFTIRLPRLKERNVLPVVTDPGEGNLVLVVDDDEMVRRATTATLWQLGYSVAASPGGEVAVELVRARPDRFSAVLLDLVMPGMTGSETFHALASLRPDIPVIVCTGFAADKHIDADVKRRIAGLVRKPFTGEQLADALRAAGVQPQRHR